MPIDHQSRSGSIQVSAAGLGGYGYTAKLLALVTFLGKQQDPERAAKSCGVRSGHLRSGHLRTGLVVELRTGGAALLVVGTLGPVGLDHRAVVRLVLGRVALVRAARGIRRLIVTNGLQTGDLRIAEAPLQFSGQLSPNFSNLFWSVLY